MDWVIISVLILLVLLGIFAVAVAFFSKKKKSPDYYALFIMGFIWMVVSIPIGNYVLATIGFIFFLIGLVNNKKWNKERHKWKNLTSLEKLFTIIAMIILAVILIFGLIFLMLIKLGRI